MSNFLKAEKVLHICAIDIYSYDSRHYFTLLDIFSDFPFYEEIRSEDVIEVKEHLINFVRCSYSIPDTVFSDNGAIFSLVDVEKNTTPDLYPQANGKIESPQANGKIERFQKELGKRSRIHSIWPDQAVAILQTTLKKAIF